MGYVLSFGYCRRIYTRVQTSSSAEIVEDVHTCDSMRVVHMRKSMQSYPTPANIRIFVSNTRPFESVLQLKNTYEQTVVTAAGAICFWPKLVSRGIFRAFDSNPGTSYCPKGRTFCNVSMNPIKRNRLRKPMESTEIYTGLISRVESIIFKNTCDIGRDDYSFMIDILENIVWAVSTHSTRYVGDIAGMKWLVFRVSILKLHQPGWYFNSWGFTQMVVVLLDQIMKSMEVLQHTFNYSATIALYTIISLLNVLHINFTHVILLLMHVICDYNSNMTLTPPPPGALRWGVPSCVAARTIYRSMLLLRSLQPN